MMSHILSFVLILAVIAGCASTLPESNVRISDDELKTIQKTVKSRTSNTLTARDLGEGQCGLFLFARSDIARLIFFYGADAESADYYDGTQEIDVLLQSTGGGLFGQFFTQMQFISDDGDVLDVGYEAGDLLEDGARVKNGRIIVTNTAGWDTILPVSGVRACN